MDSRVKNPLRALALAFSAFFLITPQPGLHSGALAQEQAEASEITSEETTPSFRIQVERNLIQVRVVVRDSKGRAVGDLRKEDFRLTDNGKPQTISHFSVEVPSEQTAAAEAASEELYDEELEGPPSGVTPQRFVALFFDDVHLQFGDISNVRKAAEQFLSDSVLPTDRVGIFTASGERQLDFTDDLGNLHEHLRQLVPRTIVPQQHQACPEISDYQAYLIAHRRDQDAINIAVEETKLCDPAIQMMLASGSEEQAQAAARERAESTAFTVLNNFQIETEHTLRGLNGVIRRMTAMPGQRTIVLVSPGFVTLTAEHRVNEIIENALRSNIIINALDSKGLYAFDPLGDASKPPNLPFSSSFLVGRKASIGIDRVAFATDVLRNVSHDTGGVFLTNSNDYERSFRRAAAVPEVYYLLAFSPENLKFNGRYHRLKVSLNVRGKYSVQARNGYFAPQKPADPAAQAKEEIEQAIFSRDEVSELPVAVNIQFFKLTDLQAKLSVLTHLDLSLLRFRKEDGRNFNKLILVTVLFDRDGKVVTGKEKRVEFRLFDGSLAKLSESGITSKTTFEIPPGSYMVRQVVRDSEGAQLSALNRRVEIPL